MPTSPGPEDLGLGQGMPMVLLVQWLLPSHSPQEHQRRQGLPCLPYVLGTPFVKAAFLKSLSRSPIFSWSTWGPWGPWGSREPRVPIPPRHRGMAYRSWDNQAVYAEALWAGLGRWWSWGCRETSWALEALPITAEPGPLSVNEGQLVMSDGGC